MSNYQYSAPIIDSAITAYEESYNLAFYIDERLNNADIKVRVLIDGTFSDYSNTKEDFPTIQTGQLYLQRLITLPFESDLINAYHQVSLCLLNAESEQISPYSASIVINKVSNPQFNFTIDGQDLSTTIKETKLLKDYSYTITGSYSTDNGDVDYLAWYRVQIFEKTTGRLVEDSDRVKIMQNAKSFTYALKDIALEGEHTLKLFAYTDKGFLYNQENILNIVKPDKDDKHEITKDNVEISLYHPDYIKIAFTTIELDGTLQISRIDNNKVTLIYKYDQTKAEVGDTFYIYDYFVEPFAQFKYLFQIVHYCDGTKVVTEYETEEPITFNHFSEDMTLINHNKTLHIKFNPELTGLKWNYSDTITPTLGGAYPVIRRNGRQRYRTFTIGGLISYNSEFNEMADISLYDSPNNTVASFRETFNFDFLSQDDLNYDISDKYYKEALLERKFRDNVLSFLHSDEVKLFKSFQEGNMLVRLTNVSLTANKQLDRNIYSFTAQATEVADPTFENCIKYNIFPVVEKAGVDAIYYNDYYINSSDGAVEAQKLSDTEAALIINKVSTKI